MYKRQEPSSDTLDDSWHDIHTQEGGPKKLKSETDDQRSPPPPPTPRNAQSHSSSTPESMDEDDFGMISVGAKREVPVAHDDAIKTTKIPPARPHKPHDAPEEPSPHLQTWRSVHDGLVSETTESPASQIASSTYSGVAKKVECFQDDRSVHFFWIDYFDANGKIFLFGKVLDRATNKYVSASVAIDGMERCVFLLPRTRTIVAVSYTHLTLPTILLV